MSPTSSAEPGPRSSWPAAAPTIVPVGPGRPVPEPPATPPAAATSPAIHTIGLHKRYGTTVAVRSLSMSVARGEVFGFLGPNGAGKTTTVKILLGLARPTGGEGLVLGAPIGDRETRRRIGYLPELFRFQPWLSAREVLRLHCRLLQMPKRSWIGSVDASLDTVGLAGRADDKVAGFSKGMQQRLGLGVALLGEPDLVILDEPTSALDPVGRHDVRQVIRDLRSRGTTVFLNTHLLEEAELICDRVAVIDKGTAIASGTLTELLGHQGRVRLKVAAATPGWRDQLSAFGTWRAEGDWVSVEGIEPDRVPDLVERIVASGGRVAAVIPGQETLEDRFLQLLDGR
jgi:ABC-2 type transport system ATP-binding protein